MDNRLVLGKLHIAEWLNENDMYTSELLCEVCR